MPRSRRPSTAIVVIASCINKNGTATSTSCDCEACLHPLSHLRPREWRYSTENVKQGSNVLSMPSTRVILHQPPIGPTPRAVHVK